MTFDEALEAVRSATVFTTHTPVPAGIDRFGADQIQMYFGGDNALDGRAGRAAARSSAPRTTPAASRACSTWRSWACGSAPRANGVSQLHGVVEPAHVRRAVAGLRRHRGADHQHHQRRPRPDLGRPQGLRAGRPSTWAPPTWTATTPGTGSATSPATRSGRPSASCASSWSRRPAAGCASSWVKRGASRAELGWVDDILDPDVLTIGFARRVPTYKRLTLILRDPARLKRLLLDPERPIQLVIAGKSHPADETGKKLIQQMVKFADDPEVRHRIVFLPNYDIAMAQYLYPGCDVWLNNPLRPFEACGTSGMKAALNGGLNLSILDGWWDEWYDGENGWAIPTADGVEDPDRRDDLEAAALYDLIETSVAPRFYDRDDDGLPAALAVDDDPHPHHARPEGPGLAAGPGLHRASCTGPPPAPGGPSTARSTPVPSRWRRSRPRCAAPGRACASTTSSPPASRTPRRSATSCTCGPSSRWASCRPTRSRCRSCTGARSESDDLRDVETAPLTFAESYEGGAHRFEGDLVLVPHGGVRLHRAGAARTTAA